MTTVSLGVGNGDVEMVRVEGSDKGLIAQGEINGVSRIQITIGLRSINNSVIRIRIDEIHPLHQRGQTLRIGVDDPEVKKAP